MVILGVIVMVSGLVANLGILTMIGVILGAIGVLPWIVGAIRRGVGGRAHSF